MWKFGVKISVGHKTVNEMNPSVYIYFDSAQRNEKTIVQYLHKIRNVRSWWKRFWHDRISQKIFQCLFRDNLGTNCQKILGSLLSALQNKNSGLIFVWLFGRLKFCKIRKTVFNWTDKSQLTNESMKLPYLKDNFVNNSTYSFKIKNVVKIQCCQVFFWTSTRSHFFRD